jgi:hypothetical protein
MLQADKLLCSSKIYNDSYSKHNFSLFHNYQLTIVLSALQLKPTGPKFSFRPTTSNTVNVVKDQKAYHHHLTQNQILDN